MSITVFEKHQCSDHQCRYDVAEGRIEDRTYLYDENYSGEKVVHEGAVSNVEPSNLAPLQNNTFAQIVSDDIRHVPTEYQLKSKRHTCIYHNAARHVNPRREVWEYSGSTKQACDSMAALEYLTSNEVAIANPVPLH